jgi:hypothetical protein
MTYPLLLVLHLLAAVAFIGTVFFEVVMLEGVRRHLPRETMREVELAIGRRARAIIPWVLLVLYGAGVGLAWQHRAALSDPLSSSFGILLTLKIALAVSVFAHFAAAMGLIRSKRMYATLARRLHLSIFCHVLAIVLLAKAMFYVNW